MVCEHRAERRLGVHLGEQVLHGLLELAHQGAHAHQAGVDVLVLRQHPVHVRVRGGLDGRHGGVQVPKGVLQGGGQARSGGNGRLGRLLVLFN